MSIAKTPTAAVRGAVSWIERLARIGYAAKGVVYVLVGILAARAAFGRGGQVTDSGGAFRTVLQQPFGQFLLMAIALGLIGYAIWRIAAAVTDAEDHGSDAKGLGTRAFLLITGVIHAGLALQAFRLAAGGGSAGGGNEPARMSGSLMDKPFGVFLLAAVGLGILAYGLGQIIHAWKSELGKQLRLTMSAPAKRWVIAISRAGMAARGVVFAVIGTFVLRAAVEHDAGEARGFEGALRALESGETGAWLFPLIAVGLIAYGIYEFIKARYRIIRAA